MKAERGNVWLGVGAVIENKKGEWLVVKKSYSGLKGVWSIPAGFVKEGETIGDAAIREVKEETGIDCIVAGLVGFRSGVIREVISDNMAILLCKPVDDAQAVVIQEREILEAAWLSVEQLANDPLTSVMLKEMATLQVQRYYQSKIDTIDPGEVFGYSDYTVYFKGGDQ